MINAYDFKAKEGRGIDAVDINLARPPVDAASEEFLLLLDLWLDMCVVRGASSNRARRNSLDPIVSIVFLLYEFTTVITDYCRGGMMLVHVTTTDSATTLAHKPLGLA